MPVFDFFTRLSCRGVWRYTLITHNIGLTQIDLIKQIYYFFCGFRESLFHIAAGTGHIRYAPTGGWPHNRGAVATSITPC